MGRLVVVSGASLQPSWKMRLSPPGEAWQDLGRGRVASFVQNETPEGAWCLLSGTRSDLAERLWPELCQAQRWAAGEVGGLSAHGTGNRHEAVAVTPPHSFPPMTPIAGGQEVRSQLGRFKGGQEPADTQQSRDGLHSHPAGDPRPAAMGRVRLLAPLGLVCCLLLLLGGSGGRRTPQGPWEEEQGPGAERGLWGRARYEAVKKHLGAVGALSKQYWQYLACKVWHEGCQEEEEEEKESSPGPGKHLLLSLPLPCPSGSEHPTSPSPWGHCPSPPKGHCSGYVPPHSVYPKYESLCAHLSELLPIMS